MKAERSQALAGESGAKKCKKCQEDFTGKGLYCSKCVLKNWLLMLGIGVLALSVYVNRSCQAEPGDEQESSLVVHIASEIL